MNIPAAPLQSGQTVAGKVSWFGGPNDKETGTSKTALGLPTSVPGIAVYNRATLGGYWKVTAANGKSAVLRQTDLGPSPLTDRKIDVTYSALGKLGYDEGNFPTNSEFRAVYLGQKAPTTAPTQSPAPRASIPGIPALNRPAFQQAQGMTQLGKLVASSGLPESTNPLFSTGLLTTKAPNPANYMTSKAPALPAVTSPDSTGQVSKGPGMQAVAFAQSHLQHDRESDGSNAGPELDHLETQFGLKGEPWCAMFATNAASRGGASQAVRTASVAEINKWASEGSHGYMYGLLPPTKAKPGDLLTFGDQHVALVKEVTSQGITTIEGNADPNGEGVVELHHGFNEGQIARPNYRR